MMIQSILLTSNGKQPPLIGYSIWTIVYLVIRLGWTSKNRTQRADDSSNLQRQLDSEIFLINCFYTNSSFFMLFMIENITTLPNTYLNQLKSTYAKSIYIARTLLPFPQSQVETVKKEQQKQLSSSSLTTQSPKSAHKRISLNSNSRNPDLCILSIFSFCPDSQKYPHWLLHTHLNCLLTQCSGCIFYSFSFGIRLFQLCSQKHTQVSDRIFHFIIDSFLQNYILMMLMNRQLRDQHSNSIFRQPEKKIKKKRNLISYSSLERNIVNEITIHLNQKEKEKKKLKIDLAQVSKSIEKTIKQKKYEPHPRSKSQQKSIQVIDRWKQKFGRIKNDSKKELSTNKDSISLFRENLKKIKQASSLSCDNKTIKVIAKKKEISQKSERVKTESHLLKEITIFTGKQLEEKLQKVRSKLFDIKPLKQKHKKKLKLKLPAFKKDESFLEETNKLLKIDAWEQSKIEESLQL